MTVLVAVDRLPASALLEAREACKALGLATAEWTGELPEVAPLAVISALDPGVRRIPDDVIALLDAIPGLPLVLCAQEPLVKPRVMLDEGRVCVLGPPIARAHIIAALRGAIAPPPVAHDRQRSRRFEVLRRAHWIAWTRGIAGPVISLHEEGGATVVLGDAAQDRSAIADVMTSPRADVDREAALGSLAGTAGVAHLSRDASEWVMYWPIEHGSLWLYSPNRVPTRWNAARSIAAGERRLLRLPAFPADQLVAAWSRAPLAGDPLTAVHPIAGEGGSQTIVALDHIAGANPQVTGMVIEVREVRDFGEVR